MAQIAEPPPQTELQAQQSVPFWRDTRILGVFGQIGFIILAILFFRLIGNNFASNVGKLGESQFICRDGTFSYLCAYDFMSSEAKFDISDTVLEYTNTDSYWFAFLNGILNTLKVGLMAVVTDHFFGSLCGYRPSFQELAGQISRPRLYRAISQHAHTPAALFHLFHGHFGLP